MADASDHEQHAVKQVIARLLDTYAAKASEEEIDGIVHRIHRRFDDSRIRDFIPLLVENAARQELAALPTSHAEHGGARLGAPTGTAPNEAALTQTAPTETAPAPTLAGR